MKGANSGGELQPETDIKPRDDSGVASAPPPQPQTGIQADGKTVTPRQKDKEVRRGCCQCRLSCWCHLSTVLYIKKIL